MRIRVELVEKTKEEEEAAEEAEAAAEEEEEKGEGGGRGRGRGKTRRRRQNQRIKSKLLYFNFFLDSFSNVAQSGAEAPVSASQVLRLQTVPRKTG